MRLFTGHKEILRGFEMDWKKVGKAIADSAPVLGGLLGGPAGGAAGALIASALGTQPNPDAVMDKIQADPAVLLQIKQLESDERQHIRDMQLSVLQSELSDIQNARLNNHSHWMPSALTIFLTLMVCAMVYAITMTEIPAANKDMAVYIFGVVTGAWTTAVSYWLGTSRSSANKDQALAGKL